MEILKNFFKSCKITEDGVILDENSISRIQKHYTNFSKLKPAKIILDKPFGVFAFINNYLGVYRIVTFHYVDFRWYSESTTAKIMHKSNIEEWRDTGVSNKFSENPYKNSGDTLGVMSGDFRHCFDEIIKEQHKRQILFEGTVEILLNDRFKQVSYQSGIGLQDLTLIEKITKNNPRRMGLHYIS
ncbi:hypothetical protein [Gelidibacter maritimus]|uniref:Uncharacterized protein n=1 Tax=Gelidibacter maritimus TaxID=2761487 RepID=A0A7W2R265_9FLAO|nr:hypothetical protein [Gelidibacter maritimus]MBA6151454.1 hypothetical protein [Gelidibacter maritimus]